MTALKIVMERFSLIVWLTPGLGAVPAAVQAARTVCPHGRLHGALHHLLLLGGGARICCPLSTFAANRQLNSMLTILGATVSERRYLVWHMFA